MSTSPEASRPAAKDEPHLEQNLELAEFSLPQREQLDDK